MIKRLSFCFGFMAVLFTFSASPAAANCFETCTPSSLCSDPCEDCVEEHPEFGCVRWAYRTCGQMGLCGPNLASSTGVSKQDFLNLLQAEASAAPASCNAGQ